MTTNKTPPQCPHCRANLGAHHEQGCLHWGQVLPSECPGVIEAATQEVQLREAAYQHGLAVGTQRATAQILVYLRRNIGGHVAQLARDNAAYDIEQGEHLKEKP